MTQKISAQTRHPSFYSCTQCNKQLPLEQVKKCKTCRTAIYCGRDCQIKHWPIHKSACRLLASQTPQVTQAISKSPLAENKSPPPSGFSIGEKYARDNEVIRVAFTKFDEQVLKATLPPKDRHLQTKRYNHRQQTQNLILRGAKNLRPDQSVVVVCGAQFYGQTFIEPLPQLLKQCKKLILVDIDSQTLEQLRERLGNAPKIQCVKHDLSGALEKLSAVETQLLEAPSPLEFVRIANTLFTEIFQKALTKEARPLPGIKEGDSVDYVISSLVASQLGIKVKETVFSMFKTRFGYPPNSIAESKDPATLQAFSRFSDLVNICNNALAKRHVDDLCFWAGSVGNIYYSDTFRLDDIPIIGDHTAELIDEALTERGSLIKREWTWPEDQQTFYPVKATLATVPK